MRWVYVCIYSREGGCVADTDSCSSVFVDSYAL